MKIAHHITKTDKSKNQRKLQASCSKAPEDLPAASIAQRYLELRKLRQQLSEAEAWRRAR